MQQDHAQVRTRQFLFIVHFYHKLTHLVLIDLRGPYWHVWSWLTCVVLIVTGVVLIDICGPIKLGDRFFKNWVMNWCQLTGKINDQYCMLGRRWMWLHLVSSMGYSDVAKLKNVNNADSDTDDDDDDDSDSSEDDSEDEKTKVSLKLCKVDVFWKLQVLRLSLYNAFTYQPGNRKKFDYIRFCGYKCNERAQDNIASVRDTVSCLFAILFSLYYLSSQLIV